jgi:hypothetical protein
MIKKILFSSILLLSLSSFAQEGTSSPYSFYGLGELKFRGTIENRAMGELGILPDSIHTNIQNPASFSSIRLSTLAIAGTLNNNSLKNSSITEKANRTQLNYIAMVFPLKKMGISLGLMPFSAVGYKILKQQGIERSRFTGEGGINKVFAGLGYQITPKFSLGLDLNYNFGQIETSSLLFKDDIQYGSRELNSAQANGLALNTGLIYQTKIKKLDFVSSATFSPSTKMNVKNNRNINTITINNDGTELITANPILKSTESKINLPSSFSFGAGLGHIKKWFVGIESTFQESSNFQNLYYTPNNATFEDASKISLGGYYVPNYNSYSNYFSKITYRAGFRYANTGLVINKQSINDTALSFGVGLPVGNNWSSVNIGLELGQKGTTKVGLIQENYLNLSIGLSFSDRWFIKRKYD